VKGRLQGKMPIDLENYLSKSWTHKTGANGKLKVAILAAGLGTRMDPLTVHHIPKPMFPLGGSTPMLELWVRKAVDAGITQISMNLSVLKDTIKSYFRDGARFGASIEYIEEGIPSGTLGGICKQTLGKNVKRVSQNEEVANIAEFSGTTVIVPSGDIVTNFSTAMLEEMYEIHRKKGAALSMLLTPVPLKRRAEFGTVVLESPETSPGFITKSGRIVNFFEKDPNSPSNLNNASVYIIEKDLLKILDPLRTEAKMGIEGAFYDFGKHVFPAMLGKIDYVSLPKDCVLWGLEYDGLWFDVGRKADYLTVNKSVLDEAIPIDIPYERFPWGYLGTNVAIDFSKVKIIPPVIIGNDCVIERDAEIGPYAIIGDGWTIERKARIRNSVLWKRYSFTNDKGITIPASERKIVDRHEVRKGVTIDESIVVGGTIEKNLFRKTVDVLESGEIKVLPINWVPKVPRI
jgi:mannose-1-phosphate guanylyltransferase/phosphomannomutase